LLDEGRKRVLLIAVFLLVAKRELQLRQEIKKLVKYEGLIIAATRHRGSR